MMSNCRNLEMSEPPNPTLPDDLVTEILLRLPIKPIFRFKCVSKPWRSLLSNTQFVRAHLKLHIHDPEHLILTSDYAPYILTPAAGAAASDGAARKVILPFEQKVWPVVAGSCDGLVLLQLHNAECLEMVFNPITLETAQIRDDRPFYSRSYIYGFGYDSSSDDYIIVALCNLVAFNGILVYVYSLRLKCWKRIGKYPYFIQNSPYDKDIAPGVFLNGCLHWLGKDSRNDYATYVIVCFDLAREEFVEGLLPISIQDFAFDIRVLEGRLALVSDPYSSLSAGVAKMNIDVWVMNEYGVQNSWTKFTTICLEEGGDQFGAAYNVVCGLSEDEIVLEKDCEQLVAYNTRNGILRDLIMADLPDGFHRVMPFRGSLVSPNL